MRKKLLYSLIGILILAFGGLIITLVGGDTPSLGLDLQGGISITQKPVGPFNASSLDLAVERIRERVDSLGVAEPEILRQGDAIVVNLPGVKNQAAGRRARQGHRPGVPAPGADQRAAQHSVRHERAQRQARNHHNDADRHDRCVVEPRLDGRRIDDCGKRNRRPTTTLAGGPSRLPGRPTPARRWPRRRRRPPRRQALRQQRSSVALPRQPWPVRPHVARRTARSEPGSSTPRWRHLLRRPGRRHRRGVQGRRRRSTSCRDGMGSHRQPAGGANGEGHVERAGARSATTPPTRARRASWRSSSTAKSSPLRPCNSPASPAACRSPGSSRKPRRATSLECSTAARCRSSSRPRPCKRCRRRSGKDSLRAAWIAGIVGVGLVLVFMLLYYRLLGFIVAAGLAVSGALIWTRHLVPLQDSGPGAVAGRHRRPDRVRRRHGRLVRGLLRTIEGRDTRRSIDAQQRPARLRRRVAHDRRRRHGVADRCSGAVVPDRRLGSWIRVLPRSVDVVRLGRRVLLHPTGGAAAGAHRMDVAAQGHGHRSVVRRARR